MSDLLEPILFCERLEALARAAETRPFLACTLWRDQMEIYVRISYRSTVNARCLVIARVDNRGKCGQGAFWTALAEIERVVRLPIYIELCHNRRLYRSLQNHGFVLASEPDLWKPAGRFQLAVGPVAE